MDYNLPIRGGDVSVERGKKLLHYSLVEKIGEGGMGEVWLARDVRLERDVAVKILPAGFAAQDQLLARFEREGRAISALNHPHICTLYDVGNEEGIHFLVMERLEGESLAERLRKGPLPLDQVLEFGSQIASALDAAHKLGIVHRDLKPDNVMLTRSGAKLLDFGLAKPMAEGSQPIQGLTDLPTQKKTLTTEGTILGTFQYMAPEQLEGLEADARTDIFALGAVLYEMATGQRAFQGKNKTSLIAAIVSSQPPPISNVMPMTPPALDHVVRRCLEKDQQDRWQSAGDIAAQLKWISTEGSQAGLAPGVKTPRRRGLLPWGIAGMMALVSIALMVLNLGGGRDAAPLVRASISPPKNTALIPYDLLGVALSPDGRRLVFAANDQGGGRRLWIRDLASIGAQPVAETNGASYPFWSPDGTHLGFFADGKLKKLDLRGGSPRDLADAPSGRGASWGVDDTILFAPNIYSSIYRIPATGGTMTEVTRYDSETEVTHRWPRILPDGEHFLFLSRRIDEEKGDVGSLMLGSFDESEPRVLLENSTNATYVEPGYIVFGRAGDLLARRFDVDTMKFLGEPVPVTTEKLSFWEPKNFVVFAASDDGTIVYLPESARESELRWFARSGQSLGAIGKPGHHSDPRLSYDGARVVFVRGRPQTGRQDVWINDLEYGREMRLTHRSGEYGQPRWSRDGSRVAFVCKLKSVQDLCIKTVGEAGDVDLLYASGHWNTAGSFMPDGKAFLFTEQDPETGEDIWILHEDEEKPRLLVQTPFEEFDAEVSPDGRWFLYVSNETGRSEVYVRETKEVSQQWQLSVDGGAQPRWRGDGREVYFIAADGRIMAVPIRAESTFRAGSPQALFELPETPEDPTLLFEDVTADGQKFLINLPVERRTSIDFRAILNWRSMLDE
ncbi:MAG: protein kinase [Acidobacteria bacterium]|nr:protein kinase [Acidobacteriota bacterium]